MYLISRIFSSSDVAFICYVSLNFVFGLCTLLMTVMPRLLAITSKAQVSEFQHCRLPQGAGAGERGERRPTPSLYFPAGVKWNVLVSTAFNLQKEKLAPGSRSVCVAVRASPRLVTSGGARAGDAAPSVSEARPRGVLAAASVAASPLLLPPVSPGRPAGVVSASAHLLSSVFRSLPSAACGVDSECALSSARPDGRSSRLEDARRGFAGCPQNLQSIYDVLKWVFTVFPQFCLGQGLIELCYNQIKYDLTHSFGVDSYMSPFEMNFLGWIFVQLASQGTVLLLLRVLLHGDLLQRSRCRLGPGSPTAQGRVPLLTLAVLQGSATTSAQQDASVVKRMALSVVAVGRWLRGAFLSPGENGAGKTTMFKMLNGDTPPTSGHAVIRTPMGEDVRLSSAGAAGVRIGYCPQQDALDDFLTGWEHLHYYCCLRGIPKQCIPEHPLHLLGGGGEGAAVVPIHVRDGEKSGHHGEDKRQLPLCLVRAAVSKVALTALIDSSSEWEAAGTAGAQGAVLPSPHLTVEVAGDLVRRLHLETHVHKLVATYSGGTKRKLSTALALLGKPDLLLLHPPVPPNIFFHAALLSAPLGHPGLGHSDKAGDSSPTSRLPPTPSVPAPSLSGNGPDQSVHLLESLKAVHAVIQQEGRRLELTRDFLPAGPGRAGRCAAPAPDRLPPPLITLQDEPSSGMDPCSKRYLWKAIAKEVQEGCAVVLTSHSMEECEALCTRLAVMVRGSCRCLGSPQHIKNRAAPSVTRPRFPVSPGNHFHMCSCPSRTKFHVEIR
ncbi:hypothetical protein CB1_000372020 [Camelus ferus]|nr:hypothetical protein CB1_000372020 [Camelus ferus]